MKRFDITNYKKRFGGQSLFEVVVALAITALIIVALVSLASNSVRNATYSKNNSLASTYAQELTEWLRSQRDANMTVFTTNTLSPTWCFPSLNWNYVGACNGGNPIAGTQFFRQATFTSTLVNAKTLIQADVTVSWDDSQGTHSVKSSTNFADWRQR